MNRLDESILRYANGSRHVIRNGVDQSIFHPGSRDESRQILNLAQNAVIGLLVANLGPDSPSKDFRTLRAALLRFSERPDHTPLDVLVVGGEAPSEKLGAVTIRYHPYCASPSKLAHYYRAADFLINPAYEETFSNVTAEAMCCGLPVLANRVAALPEIVTDGRTGLLVPPGDVEALAIALDRLSRDSPLRQRLSIEAAAYAKRTFSLEQMIDRYLEILEKIADKQSNLLTLIAD